MFNEFITSQVIPAKMIADQMVTAIEGGSGYWCQGFHLVSSAVTPSEKPWYSDPKLYTQDFIIEIYDDNDKSHKLMPPQITRGLDVMGKKHPRHMADMLTENGDATTADVFLQLCVFGELVYG